jgi:hypothetical protein
MIRMEIIADNAVEEDIMEALRAREEVTHFTKIPNVHGEGDSTPKHGNHIWPEENFILIVYAEEGTALHVREAVKEIKDRCPDAGIKLFEISSSL